MTNKQQHALRKLKLDHAIGCYGVMTNVDCLVLCKMGFFLRSNHNHRLGWLKDREAQGDVKTSWWYFKEPKAELVKMIFEAKDKTTRSIV